MTIPPIQQKVGERCTCCNTADLVGVMGLVVCVFCDQVPQWPIAAHPAVAGLIAQSLARRFAG